MPLLVDEVHKITEPQSWGGPQLEDHLVQAHPSFKERYTEAEMENDWLNIIACQGEAMKNQNSEWSLVAPFVPWEWMCSWLSGVWLFVTPWTVACKALLSMEFSRQEYWSGDPGIKTGSPTLQADTLPSKSQGSSKYPGCDCSLPTTLRIQAHR